MIILPHIQIVNYYVVHLKPLYVNYTSILKIIMFKKLKKYSHNSERRSCLMDRIFFMIASTLLVQGKTNHSYSLGSAKY